MNNDDTIPNITELRNKPLAEVIFELRWSLQATQPGFQSDPGFRILVGRYYDRVSKQYPVMKDLPVTQVPEEMTAYAVRHQFWSPDAKWPVTQVGPGILTVNDTVGYKWESFKPRLTSAVQALFESYPNEIAPLTPTAAELKYINAVPVNLADTNGILSFLQQSLHTTLQIDPRLFDDSQSATKPLELNLTLTYPLTKPQGVGILLFATGMKGQQPSLIWQIIVRSTSDKAPQKASDFDSWLVDAHAVVKRWFGTLCRGPLLKTFE